MKIGIIGYGFVGKALEASLRDNVEIINIDPKLGTQIKALKAFTPDAIFICVPTPTNKDLSQDISILTSVINEIKELNLNTLTVLKSTVLPNYITEIESLIPEFVYNPEFLREKHAIQDFIDSKLIVFGGSSNSSDSLADIYKNYTKCIHQDYIFTDPVSASLIKYTINSFLATKVTFFNEVNQLFQASETKSSWDDFVDAVSRDERVGKSHMQVPGHDGRLGFGGACLPKDSNAFSIYADSKNVELNVLKSAINSNNTIRASYNVGTERELDQNIKFKGDS
jgi:nucleotide sugar dehydrogenase